MKSSLDMTAHISIGSDPTISQSGWNGIDIRYELIYFFWFWTGTQDYMLKAYKAGIGALGTFWYMYVYWLLMETAAYSIFAKKDYDYYDYYDEEEEERAADPSTIDVSAIFNGLKAIREKSSRVSDDPCYLQSFCQARQYLGSFLPNFL